MLRFDEDHWYFSTKTVAWFLVGGLVCAAINFYVVTTWVYPLAYTLAILSGALLIAMHSAIHPYRWKLMTLGVFRIVVTVILLGAVFLFYRLAKSLDEFSMAAMLQIFCMAVVGIRLPAGFLTDRWLKRTVMRKRGEL